MKKIVTFDLETTGVNTETDQICQYCFTKIDKDANKIVLKSFVKPSIPIPAEASEVTGIYDEDVKDAYSFKHYADSILTFIEDSILAGYNIRGYDVPLLVNEFIRHGFPGAISIFDMEMIDVMVLYKKYRNHKLTTAVKDLCGYDLEDAHDAEGDVDGTRDVLYWFFMNMGVLVPDMDVSGMEKSMLLNLMIQQSTPEGAVDFAGKLKDVDGKICYTFGKHNGEGVLDNYETRKYAKWMLKSDFQEQTKNVLRSLLNER